MKVKNLLFIILIQFFPAQESWNLQQCLDFALANHPLIKQANINVDKSDRQISAAKGLLLPSINAGVSRSYSFGSTINPSSNQREALNLQYDQFSAQANWELFNWQNYVNISLSKINKETLTYRHKKIQNDVKLNVIQKFFDYQNSKSWLAVLQTQIDGIEDQIRRTEKEVEIGNRAKSDIYDIKANLGTLQEQWISAKTQKELAKNNLLNALSIIDDSIEFGLENDEVLVTNDLENSDFVKNLLEKNPAYLSSQNEIKNFEKNINFARAAYLPTINGSYSWSTFYTRTLKEEPLFNFGDQFKQNKNQQVYFGLNIPIFNKLQIKSNVEIAKLNVINAKLEKDLVINDLMQSINSIKIQFSNAQEKYKLLEQNFENQKLSFQKSEEKYQEGLMDAYTFFAVRNAWLQANYNLINSKNEVIQQQQLLKVYEAGL